ncbi:MAG: hypothetical protein ACRCZL_04605, partial [Cetobacterium sp.]
MENNNLIELQNNSLLKNDFDEPVTSVEDAEEKLNLLNTDYDKMAKVFMDITDYKFYKEGKILSELKKVECKLGNGKWEKAYKRLKYTRETAETLIRKYEISEKFCASGTELEKIESLDSLSKRETKQLADMESEKQKALLESENLKAELKALREQTKRELEEFEEEKQELAEKLETVTALKEDNADYLIVLESEISKLSKELNSRPIVEKEIEKVVTVEKLVEREVVPNDYVLIKSNIEKYKTETERRNKELADLKVKLEKVKEDNKWKVKELEFKLTAQDND